MEILTNESFKEKVVEAKGVVLVDFFATWCGPCRMLAPILEQVQGEVDCPIYKVDVDECFDTAKSFGIMSVPTMILFKDGLEIEKIVGLRQKSQIIEAINEIKD